MERSIRDITKEIGNIINVISKTGSDALVNRLNELERTKAEQEYRLRNLEAAAAHQTVSAEEIVNHFRMARSLFESGELKSTKRLVQTFVKKVVIFEEHIEVFLNIHPNMRIPECPEEVLADLRNGEQRHADMEKPGHLDNAPAVSNYELHSNITVKNGVELVEARGVEQFLPR